ncbi:MAG: virulence RhuM family protein [Proteobacteria bacterium]|nr:virulence RhuM family protein [Pseudomonadota bacterium]MBU1736958.1 virulence RhuM family protein [Pseudomonadota bacterium]
MNHGTHGKHGKDGSHGKLLVYQADDGRVRLNVRLQGETVWLTQPMMAELFQTTQQNISQHILNIYGEEELAAEATHKKFLSVRREGKRDVRRELDFYNLDMIISVGYRVKSAIATRFRIWATERLKEYLVKGFTMDDERLKKAGGGSYFDELLARIRDIRSSEKVFWRKVLDIYATSEEDWQGAERMMNHGIHGRHGNCLAQVVSGIVCKLLESRGMVG